MELLMAKEDGLWDNPTRQTWENGDYLSASKLRLSSSPMISKRTGAKKGSKRNLARPSCLVAYRGNGDWDDGKKIETYRFLCNVHNSLEEFQGSTREVIGTRCIEKRYCVVEAQDAAAVVYRVTRTNEQSTNSRSMLEKSGRYLETPIGALG
ncbi:hypothetical protein TESG_03700 [Trichophyton tonsurans CBS 112818]|uniref:Uncharacterized protein n=2 Tax=Trichophyton TaxID=5550 RepID=F2PZI5_TRIEC|nr:hypothetical protein TESG_03700 [Trichophyton tonsurans CBS 112818]EGE07303.1 hypothetical protein TEQG_06212 [Trichophyton equinum CBS 127.97]